MKKAQNKYERLVIVSYRLPFKFVYQKKSLIAVQNSGGLVSAILSLSEKMNAGLTGEQVKKIVWVGKGESLPNDFTYSPGINNRFDLHPVHIPKSINDNFYGGFCNDTIWPLFHYFPSFANYPDRYYRAYQQANKLFFEQLATLLKPGDFVWIHDYQLFLLPELIRQAFPGVIIGFFLHIPFPSYEILRLLPRTWHNSILNGMLGADVVGFHTYDYAHYFLRSVQKSLGYITIKTNIVKGNRRIVADDFPIGIDYEKFNHACSDRKVVKEKIKLRKNLRNKKLVFSVDRLDYSKGLLARLNGIESFLRNNPQWHERVIFNMVVVPSRDTIVRYTKMKKEIEATIGRINGAFGNIGWRPVIYEYKSLGFHELVARYDISDVGLITPIRDGMNLVAKEYVACQVENRGVLILSEMAGASIEMTDALIINPVDHREMACAIRKALEMPQEEVNARLARMQKRIRTQNVFKWAEHFISRTIEVAMENRADG